LSTLQRVQVFLFGLLKLPPRALGRIQKSESLGFTGLACLAVASREGRGRFVGRFHPFGTISKRNFLGKMRLGTIWSENFTPVK